MTTYGSLGENADYQAEATQSLKQEKQILNSLARDLEDVTRHKKAKTVRKLVRSYRKFASLDSSDTRGYSLMRQLYFETAGKSNDLINRYLSVIYPKPAVPAKIESVLGSFDASKVAEVVKTIREEGFYEFDEKISPALVATLIRDMDATAEKNNGAGFASRSEDRIRYYESTLINSGAGKVAADPLFYYICSEYLNTQPVLNQLLAWTSRPHANDKELLSKSAQVHHVDMSHPNFLKLFIYLNDVDESNGPHCLIPKTHDKKAIWRDGRIDDDEMCSHYPRDTWKEQMGAAGSVFIVDTKAFHKGTPLIKGERRLLQFYYTDTLFGESKAINGPDLPKFKPELFGPAVKDYSTRFLQNFALHLPK